MSVADAFSSMRRGPQIITQKDIGLILGYTGASAGWKVVEGGSGSGALTMYLANAVRPSGRVFSYDNREEHQIIAKENVKKAGLDDYVKFHLKDIKDGIKEVGVDMVVLDIPEPWDVVKHAEKCLKKGGFFVVYVPTYEQLKNVSVNLQKRSAFSKPHAIEGIVREIKVSDISTRPFNMGLVHTGFLVFSRRL